MEQKIMTRLEILQEELVKTHNRITSLKITEQYMSRKAIKNELSGQSKAELSNIQANIKVNEEFLTFLEEQINEEKSK